MRISTRVVFQMNNDGTFTELERDSYDYTGPFVQAFGGDVEEESTTITDIDTTQVGIEQVEGVGIAAAGDVNFTQEITQTDQGAIESSFEFAEELGSGAFDFAGDVARQAGETSQKAVELSRQAITTVATGGASDIASSNVKVIGFVAAALAAIFVLPRIFRSA